MTLSLVILEEAISLNSKYENYQGLFIINLKKNQIFVMKYQETNLNMQMSLYIGLILKEEQKGYK